MIKSNLMGGDPYREHCLALIENSIGLVTGSGDRPPITHTGLRGFCALGFLKFQYKAVAFADRRIFFVILVLQPESGRQSPHTFGIVLGVLRVGVDLG